MNIVLTPRETDVFRELMRDGASNRTIGRRLHIAEDTVKVHIRRIFTKAGIRDRTELAVAVFRDQIIVNNTPWGGDSPLCRCASQQVSSSV